MMLTFSIKLKLHNTRIGVLNKALNEEADTILYLSELLYVKI